MNDAARLIGRKYSRHGLWLYDIALLECKSCAGFHRLEGGARACVGELVHAHDLDIRLRDDMPAEGRPDEAGSAGNNNRILHCLPWNDTAKGRHHAAELMFKQVEDIFAVTAGDQGMRELLKLLIVDEAHPPGDLLDAGDFLSLPFFDRLNKMAGFEKGVVGSGIKPRISSPQPFD